MIDLERLARDAAECNPAPSDSALARIAELGRQQQRLERALARRQKLAKLTEEKLAQVAERELPDAMAAVGMEEFKLDNGYRVTVSKEYYANIPSPDSEDGALQARRADAFEWMRANKHGDLIKGQVVVSTGRGQDEIAARVIRGLEKAGIPYMQTETVHASTLKAFVREQLEMENPPAPFPDHLFGVCVKRVAKLKPARKGK